VDSDPASERSPRRIKMWIEECSEQHSSCRVAQRRYSQKSIHSFPTRLLDLGQPELSDGSSCKLVDGPCSLVRYITLIYCWGKTRAFKALRSNLSRHKDRIVVKDMPLNLQHAVFVTRKLNIRYLWIDASCIVQDDLME